MPKVDPDTGNPISDAPDSDDESARGGEGRGDSVDANAGPPEGSGVTTGPNNPREARPGATLGDTGNDPSGSNAAGGV